MKRTGLLLSCLLIAALALSVVVTGCGSTDKEVETEQQKSLEEYTFTADDYPTKPGTKITYFQNKTNDEQGNQQDTVPVSFDLEGPWDFREGPDDDEPVLTILEEKNAPDADSFPTADVIERLDIGTSRVDTYRINDNDGLKTVGEAIHTTTAEETEINTFSPAYISIEYPLSEESTWTDSYQVATAGVGAASRDVNETRKVMAINKLVTPYKSYDRCFLVQIRKEETGSSGPVTRIEYHWYVKSVGVAVIISSMTGETEDVFSQAEMFRRLKDFSE